MIEDPQVDDRVCVASRRTLVGTIVAIHTATFVSVKFDNIEEPVQVNTQRLAYYP